MDARQNHALLHWLAEIDHGFDNAVVLGEGKAFAGRHIQPSV